MEWPLALGLLFGSVFFLMLTGMPVAFCFMLVSVVGVAVLWGGATGLEQLIMSIKSSVVTFVLMPVVLFTLMGDLMYYTGMAPQVINTVDQWMGRLPGRMSLIAVGAGTIFAALSGTNLASIAMLGSTLAPDMEKRGYKKSMILGPILGSGGLALMIPPTSLGVLLAAIARISVGKFLMAIIFPGLLMALLYVVYIIVRCKLQPSLAPPYELPPPTPISHRLLEFSRYILPLGFIVFLVIGVMFLGLATPNEAACTGALGTFILAAIYKKLNWNAIKKSLTSTVEISSMFLMIVVGAASFSQILAFTGASRGLVEMAISLPVAPIFIIIAIMIVVIIMGMFMDVVPIMMIIIPITFPVIQGLGYDPIWFGIIFLINTIIGTVSPPFGLACFVMKGVSTPSTTMGDIYRAGLPFIGLQLIVIVLVIAFPALALWLPAQMIAK